MIGQDRAVKGTRVKGIGRKLLTYFEKDFAFCLVLGYAFACQSELVRAA